MRILALDVATKTGWAVNTSTSPEKDYTSGVVNMSLRRDEGSGMMKLKFKKFLLRMFKFYKPDIVIYERTSGHHKNAIIFQSELHGVLKLVCEENKIPFRAYSAPEIKKHVVGKGNANKEAMIKAAKQQYGYTGEDSDEADAICILKLGIEEYGNL